MTELPNPACGKSCKGKLVGIILAVAVIGGGIFAYTKGLIPGVGAGNQVAEEVKQEVEALQGEGFNEGIKKVFDANFRPVLDEEQQKEFDEGFNKFIASLDYNFSYKEIKTITEPGKGGVEITDAVLSFKSPEGANAGEAEQRTAKVIILRDVNDPGRYVIDIPTPVEYYADFMGQKQKIAVLESEQYTSELKLNDANEVEVIKSVTKNLVIKEARGNTVLAKIAESGGDFTTRKTGEDAKTALNFYITNFEFGDMAKLMLGPIEPVSMKFDADYNGTSLGSVISRLAELDSRKQAARKEGKEEPAEEKVEFDADIKVKEFSLFMGESGVKSLADLKFGDSEKREVPKGEASISIVKHRKLLDFIQKSFGVAAADFEKFIAFAKEIGEEKGDDIVVKIKFDGTDNVLIGGKTPEEVKAIEARHFQRTVPAGIPQDGGLTTSSGGAEASPSVPEKVESKPLEEHDGHAH